MRLTFIQMESFVSRWRSMKLTDDDLIALEDALSSNPTAGAVVPGTNGLRKVRFAPPSARTGKRGGARVCYALFTIHSTVYLMTVYGKNFAEDLSAEEKKYFHKLLRKLKEIHS